MPQKREWETVMSSTSSTAMPPSVSSTNLQEGPVEPPPAPAASKQEESEITVAVKQEVDENQRDRSSSRISMPGAVDTGEVTEPILKVVTSNKDPVDVFCGKDIPVAERAVSGQAIGARTVELLRDKRCKKHDILNALADMSSGPSSSLRNMVFNNDCQNGIDRKFAALKTNELHAVAGRLKGPWIQALLKTLNDDPKLAFDIDPNSVEFLQDLKSSLKMIDQKADLPSKKPSTRELLQARFDLRSLCEQRKSETIKRNYQASNEELTVLFQGQRFGQATSLFASQPEGASEGTYQSSVSNVGGANGDQDKDPLALLSTANIVVRKGHESSMLSRSRQDISKNPDKDAEGTQTLLQDLLTSVQCKQVTEYLSSNIFAQALSSDKMDRDPELEHRGVPILTNIVINVSDNGEVDILAQQEVRYSERHKTSGSGEIKTLNPNSSYLKTTINSSISNNGEVVVKSLTQDFQSVPLANDCFVSDPEVANRYRNYERIAFAVQNRVVERFPDYSVLAAKGEQFRCASRLEKYVLNAVPSVTSLALLKENSDTDLSPLLLATRKLSEQFKSEPNNNPEHVRIAKLMEVNDISVVDMRDSQAQVKRFDAATEIDEDLIAKTKTALVKMRAIQGHSYQVLQELPSCLEQLEEDSQGLKARFKDEIDISLGLHAHILAEAERVGSELEVRIIDELEDFHPRGEISEAIQDIGQDRLDFAVRQKDAISTAVGTLEGRSDSERNTLAEMKTRLARDNGFDPLKYGPGLKKKGDDYRKAAKVVAQHLRTGDGTLPAHLHGLSMGQVAELVFADCARRSGMSSRKTKSLIKKLDREVKKEFSAGLAQNWPLEVSHTFSDNFSAGEYGKRHNLEVTSTITPRLHEEDTKQVAVPAGARSQGKHICNLAHTQLTGKERGTDRQPEVMFSGLRHGVLDSYEISKAGIKNMTEEQRTELLSDTKETCEKIVANSRHRARLERKINRLSPQRFYLRTAEGRDLLRRAANVNAAQELVEEALKRSPSDLQMAFNSGSAVEPFGGDVIEDQNSEVAGDVGRLTEPVAGEEGDPVKIHVDINSISLLTPDPARRSLNFIKKKILGKTNGGSSERKMLLHQKHAFQDLVLIYPNGVPVRVEHDEKVHSAVVVPRCRLMNFSVNKFAVKDKGAGQVPKKIGLMGWRKSNRYNTASIHDLTGKFATKNYGLMFPAVKYVVQNSNLETRKNELEGVENEAMRKHKMQPVPELSVQEKVRIDWVISNNQYFKEDPERYCNVVMELSKQIKEIYESGSHEDAGHEPYKLASRVAVLSFLLGQSTAFNCKSGKDRTGALDMEIKSLAAKVSVGEVPQPDQKPTAEDRARKTTYALKTGNLEMQKCNTGMRGYKLFGVPAVFRQLQSGLAQRLFSGDSKLVAD